MNDVKILGKMLDGLDDKDLSYILLQVARRILVSRADSKDCSFWFFVLSRVAKWLDNPPVFTDEERLFLTNPPEGVNGKIRAIKSIRARTGMRLFEIKTLVETWMTDNNIANSTTNSAVIEANNG